MLNLRKHIDKFCAESRYSLRPDEKQNSCTKAAFITDDERKEFFGSIEIEKINRRPWMSYVTVHSEESSISIGAKDWNAGIPACNAGSSSVRAEPLLRLEAKGNLRPGVKHNPKNVNHVRK